MCIMLASTMLGGDCELRPGSVSGQHVCVLLSVCRSVNYMGYSALHCKIGFVLDGFTQR